MKWIFAILLFISAASFGQIGRGDDSTKYIRYQNQYGMRMPRSWWDSVAHMPYGDTATFPKPIRPGAIMMHTDKSFYKWNGGGWDALGGGAPSGPAGGALTGTYPNPSIADDSITQTKLRQSVGLSVMGNIGNTTDYPGDIVAANDGNVLRRFGTSLGFGAINLASSNAVTGILPIGNTDTSSTNHLITQSDLNDTAAALRAAGGTPQVQNSITGDGSSGNKLRLVNDASTPGNNYLYGTDYSGTKGYVQPDVDWYNVKKAGADPSGATDISSYITSAITAGKKNIYLPDGIFLISTEVQLKDSVVIRGAGQGRTIIKLTSNITAFKATYALGGNKAQIQDLTFQGTYGGTGTTSQKGIVADSAYGMIIKNISGYFMAGFVVSIGNNALIPSGNKAGYGNQVLDSYFETCYGGVLFDVRGEYNVVSNTTVVDGAYGLYITGGNNKIVGCHSNYNAYNIYLTGGANNAHGTITACNLNHASSANVYATGVTLGMDLVGNEIFSGAVTLINSDAINFTGGTIEVATITITNCTNSNFFGTRISGAPTWAVTGNAPGMFRLAEGSVDGLIIEDVKNNKQSQFINDNGIFSFGKTGGNTQQYFFHSPIVGTNGSYDANRDLCVGKARFDLGSTTGDGVQIYKSGSSGSTLAILDNSANYQVYAKPNGNTGIGNNSSPTALLHIAAGTATAGTAPLKFTSGTPTTTPETGAMQFNNGLFIIDSSNSVRDTIATRSWARSNLGGNISNTSLTANGSYTQDWNHYPLTFNNVNQWSFSVSENDATFSTIKTNNFFSSGNNFTSGNGPILLYSAMRKADNSADSIQVGYRVSSQESKLFNTDVANSLTSFVSAAKTSAYIEMAGYVGQSKISVDSNSASIEGADSIIIKGAAAATPDSLLGVTQTNAQGFNKIVKTPASNYARILKGSTSWQPGTVAAGSSATTTVSVTGAALGDPVTVSKASGAYSNGELYDAFVSATNTVTIRVHNVSTGSANYNTTETYNVVLLKY